MELIPNMDFCGKLTADLNYFYESLRKLYFSNNSNSGNLLFFILFMDFCGNLTADINYFYGSLRKL